jgi:hypothetical protein
VAADGFLVMAHDTPARVAAARAILETTGASRVDVHLGLTNVGVGAVAA